MSSTRTGEIVCKVMVLDACQKFHRLNVVNDLDHEYAHWQSFLAPAIERIVHRTQLNKYAMDHKRIKNEIEIE